jgi:GNAT superfamily N-acetyltransferase
VLSVRDATEDDAAAVAAVHVRAWQVAYRGLLPDAGLDALRAEDRASRYSFGSAGPDSPDTLLAVEDGAVRGFASVGPAHETDAEAAGELAALYVDPPHWGTGIGRLLMAHAYGRLRERGFEQAILWMLAGNERAERFYRADGWEPDGVSGQRQMWDIEVDVVRYRRALG